MNGYLWRGGATIGLICLGESTSPQGRWNHSSPSFASARTQVDHGEVPNSSMAWRKQLSDAWHHKSADPEKRSLRIEVSLNSHSNLRAPPFAQSDSPRLSTKLSGNFRALSAARQQPLLLKRTPPSPVRAFGPPQAENRRGNLCIASASSIRASTRAFMLMIKVAPELDPMSL
jgi:hypothetical protein